MDNNWSITTPRLVIRQLKNSDREEFDRLRSMPQGFTHQSRQPREIREGNLFQLTKPVVPNTPDTLLPLALCLEDGTMIGDIWIRFPTDGYQAEIGYALSPNYLGQGYATEGMRAIVRYLFITLGKHRVTISLEAENPRSIRVMERLGFRQEAHFVKSIRVDGQWVDEYVYALLCEDWEKTGGGEP
jgi:RimJ/RimL family protein N-acetyltransferase